ncbi:MAG: VWA domain-containing protein [Candidatus Lokiarchaeia archaeon]
MLKEIEPEVEKFSENIHGKMAQKDWKAAVKGYLDLRETFLKSGLNLQASLTLVSISALREKMGEIEEAGKTMIKAAEEFESLKKMGYVLRAYQRALNLMETSKKTELAKELQEKIDSLSMLELVIVTDSTGSMGGALEAIKTKIAELLYQLSEKIPGVRVGALTYRDHCDENSSYLLSAHPFTDEHKELISFIKQWTSKGGGDIPEAVEDALNYLDKGYDWELAKRVVIIIGDAPPHTSKECPKNLDWKEETKKLADKEVKVYTVLCGGDPATKDIWGQISDLTQADTFQIGNYDDLPDLIVAITLSQVGLAEDYILDLEAKGQLAESKKELIQKIRRRE